MSEPRLEALIKQQEENDEYNRLTISSEQGNRSIPTRNKTLWTKSTFLSNLEYPCTPLLSLQLHKTPSYSFLLHASTAKTF